MPNYRNTVWTEDSGLAPRHPRLSGNVDCDVAIIGAGITGVTAACLLKRAGKRVALLESRRVGKGETAHTTAHLTEVLDEPYHRLVAKFGDQQSSRIARAQRDAIARIETFVDELSIECSFARVPGYLYTEHEEDAGSIEKEASVCQRLGLNVTLLNHAPLPFPTVRALRFANQAQFQPRRYLLALADTIGGDGCQIFEDCHAVDIELTNDDPIRIICETGVVHAGQVIVAAHVPLTNRFFTAGKIPASRTYVIGVRTPNDEINSLYWDTDNPYHYIRSHRGQDGDNFLLVGGADHRVGKIRDTSRPFAELESYVRKRFGALPIQYRWSGQVINPLDGLPYIGRTTKSNRLFVATGYAGQGMTMGTIAAGILTDAIMKRDNPYADMYRATRINPLRTLPKLLSENADFPSHLVRDRLRREETSVHDLAAGEGEIATVNGERLAAYRDHAGALRALSPVCTHMGCMVHWNSAAKSWDCPCHGSRYDPIGRVLNGPATRALDPRPLPPEWQRDNGDAHPRAPVFHHAPRPRIKEP